MVDNGFVRLRNAKVIELDALGKVGMNTFHSITGI
jgi:hypothetical protein